MRLFSDGHLEEYLNEKVIALKAKVEKMKDQEIISCDFGEYVAYLVGLYQVEPIALFPESIQQSICETQITVRSMWARYGEKEYVDVDGYKISFDIPYDGDSHLLRLRASCFSLGLIDVESYTSPHGTEYGKITIALSFTRGEFDQAGEKIKGTIEQRFQHEYSSLASELESINNDVNAYNNSLASTVLKLLTLRKEKAQSFAQVSQIFQIPLPLQNNAQSIHPIQLTRTVKQPPAKPASKPLPTEYTIADQDYNRIVEIIYSAGTTMEKTARSYYGTKLEEELRDVLLLAINTQYENASGETFRRVGKTDIRIEMENQAAYIAECKIWHGAKAFDEAVSQLMSYCTWRDTKTSLVIFNKTTKDFSKVLKEISRWLSEHAKSIVQKKPNMWTCQVHKEDANTDVRINIAVFDLCVDKSEFTDQRFL